MKAWEMISAAGLLLIAALRTKGTASAPPAGTTGFQASCLDASVQPYADLIQSRAAAFGVPPELLAALIVQESGGNPQAARFEPSLEGAYQSQGASVWGGALADGWTYQTLATSIGLTQVLGATGWKDLAAHYPPTRYYEPYLNVSLGAKYLSKMYAQFGNWRDALRAYNAGPTGAANDPTRSGQYADNILAIYQRTLTCEGG